MSGWFDEVKPDGAGPSGRGAEAAQILREVWDHRSRAERGAFVEQTSRIQSTVEPGTEDVLTTIRDRAALCGSVAPRDLTVDIDDDRAAWALDTLAAEFDRSHTGQHWSWTLRQEPRRTALQHLATSQGFDRVLSAVSQIPTDDAGLALRRLIAARHSGGRDRTNATVDVSTSDAPVLLQALTWAGPFAGRASDLAEVRRRTELGTLIDGYRELTRHGVFGRDDELRRLATFAEAPIDAPYSSTLTPLLPVTGVGGAGKSTLLAAFLLPHLEAQLAGDSDAPVVIVLDFDRSALRTNPSVALSFELTRQLGWMAPIASADFAALRYRAVHERQAAGGDRLLGMDSESADRDVASFDEDARYAVELHGLHERRIVLVLDTFEEWQRDQAIGLSSAWDNPEARILNWVDTLRYRMGLAGLRVVVSGRAPLSSTGSVDIAPAIDLGDLDQTAATQLLRQHGAELAAVGRLAELSGRNPLTLRIAARFYSSLDAADRAAFLAADVGTADLLDAELRQAVLYDRFLAHAAPTVRPLAHPGLVLRRITPALVRHVLAGPCGLDDVITQSGTAEALIERLAQEVWLVKRTDDGLRHLPQVRRAMLRLMAGDPDKAAAARRIHAAAAEWYDDDRDPTLRGEQAAIEALYHRLMLHGDGEELLGGAWRDGEVLQRILALGADIDDLPRDADTQVRALLGEDLPVNDQRRLPAALWSHWAGRRGDALLKDDRAAEALALVTERIGRLEIDREPAWLAEACACVAQYEAYWTMIATLDRDQAAAASEQRAGRYALVNAIGADEHVDTIAGAYRGHLETALEHASPERRPAQVLEWMFFEMLLRVGADGLSTLTLTPGMIGRLHRITERRPQPEAIVPDDDRYPVDQLRRALVWVAAPSAWHRFTLRALDGIFRPDPAWLRRFATVAGPVPPAHDEIVDAMEHLESGSRPTARAHELLGTWAVRFARAWRKQVELTRTETSHRDQLMLMRGDNPEFRPAIRTALTGLLTDETRLRQIANVAQHVVPVPVVDLSPDEVPHSSGSHAHSVLIQLVEYVDRSGATGAFLDGVRDEVGSSPTLTRVARAYEAWDRAHRSLLEMIAIRIDANRG